MAKHKLIYLVWNSDDPDCNYWEQFDSLSEAVTNHPKKEVFTAKPRLLGRFNMKTAPVRIKRKKKA